MEETKDTLDKVILNRDTRTLFSALRNDQDVPSSILSQEEFNESKNKLTQPETICRIKDDFKKEMDNGYKELQEACNKTKRYISTEDQEQYNSLIGLMSLLFEYEEITSLDRLFDFFPDITEGFKGSLNRPRIFEALWKIVFLLRLENIPKLSSYKERIFFKSIETRIVETVEQYLHHKINDGNSSGMADLLFSTGDFIKKETSSCDDQFDVVLPDNNIFIVTSKYYKSEKGVDKYDIEKLILRAKEEYKDQPFSIMIWVKDKNAFMKKLYASRNRDEIGKYIDEDFVLDMSDLHHAFNRLHLYINSIKENDTYLTSTEFKKLNWLKKDTVHITSSLELRFHQEYIVEYTKRQFKRGIRKMMWGSVPRSGKSYMVGGLIVKNKPQYVLLILGAISETKGQFITDLFKEYQDFHEYKIIDLQDLTQDKRIETIREIIIRKNKCIIITSQELLREQIEEYLDKDKYNTEHELHMIHELEPILNQEPYIFFDEVHQGGGLVNKENMQDQLLNFLYVDKDNHRRKNPYICFLTATYIKPTLKYGSSLPTVDRGHGPELKLITWSYDNTIRMKQFDTIDDLSELIDSSSSDQNEKKEILEQLTRVYEEKGISRNSISNSYKNYPELQVFIPTKINIQPSWSTEYGDIDVTKLFRLNYDSKKKTYTEFSHENYVNELLNLIYTNVYEPLYKNNLVYDGSKFHSQLWFLPTSLTSWSKKNPGLSMDESDEDNPEKQSILELISRFLAYSISKHIKYQNFTIAIVHSLYVPEYVLSTFGDRIFLCNGKDVKSELLKAERKSKRMNKSLIILTGKRLRLGVSLNCVDIALHMDPIKSVDTIYQSMFRVLTERKGKSKGIFVDLLPHRAISFMYQIGEYTGKKSITREDIIETLFLFNVNQVRSLVLDTSRYGLDAYHDLLSRCKLDTDQNFNEFYENVYKESIEQLEDQFVKEMVQNKDVFILLDLIDLSYTSQLSKIKIETVKEGVDKNKDLLAHVVLDVEEKEENPLVIDISVMKSKLKQIVSNIKYIISLYILFTTYLHPSLEDLLLSLHNTYTIDEMIECLEQSSIACYLYQLYKRDKNITNTDLHVNDSIAKYKQIFDIIMFHMSDDWLTNLFNTIQRQLANEKLALDFQQELNMDWGTLPINSNIDDQKEESLPSISTLKTKSKKDTELGKKYKISNHKNKQSHSIKKVRQRLYKKSIRTNKLRRTLRKK